MPAQSTLTNTLLDDARNPLRGVPVQFQLVLLPTAFDSDEAEIGAPIFAYTDEGGIWTVSLPNTTELTPVGAVWKIVERISAVKIPGGQDVTWYATTTSNPDTSLLANLTTPPGASPPYIVITVDQLRCAPTFMAMGAFSTIGA